MHDMSAKDRAQIYDRPPIVEAVFEIQFASAVAEPRRKKLRDWLAGSYQTSSVEEQVGVHIDFASRSAKFDNRGPTYKLASSDLADECIISANAIAWIRRAPYAGWQAFHGRFANEVAQALKAADNPTVSRLGLRYVNRIDVRIVNNLATYEEFLNFRIQYGDILEPTTGFHWQLVKEFPEEGLKATVQSASVTPEILGYGAFSFDIDVYCDSTLPGKEADILARVDQMRLLKNRIFEAGITDKAREHYSNA